MSQYQKCINQLTEGTYTAKGIVGSEWVKTSKARRFKAAVANGSLKNIRIAGVNSQNQTLYEIRH